MPATTTSYPWEKEELETLPPPRRQDAKSLHDPRDPTGFYSKMHTVGLHIWRYQQEDLVSIAREDYGHFCSSELYVIVHVASSIRNQNAKLWNIHMWAGKHSTFVNYKATMMKVIELDTIVDDSAILYREVQDKESEMFKSYFETITYWMDSHRDGYREMARRRQKFRARLLEFYKPLLISNYYCAKEILANKRLLDPSHVFILDAGDQLIQWNGALCNSDDVIAGIHYAQALNACRGGTTTVMMVDEKDKNDEMSTFYHHLSTAPISKELAVETPEVGESPLALWKRALGLTSSRSKYQLIMSLKKKGVQQHRLIRKGDITWKDVKKRGNYILNTGDSCYFWLNQQPVTSDLKSTALQLAHNYLTSISENTLQPIIVFRGDQRCAAFETALGSREAM